MGEVDDSLQSKRIVFVTVGTTSFDSLVRAVDTREVRKALFEKGYTHLLIQMGRGSYIPMKSAGEDGFVSVDYFTFSPSIADHMRSAYLVISHAGSGSIFETLRLSKPLIVVVNEDLMDNHQSELAEELAERKHLFCASPQTLFNTISEMKTENLVAYEPGDASPVARFINHFLGFSSEGFNKTKKDRIHHTRKILKHQCQICWKGWKRWTHPGSVTSIPKITMEVTHHGYEIETSNERTITKRRKTKST